MAFSKKLTHVSALALLSVSGGHAIMLHRKRADLEPPLLAGVSDAPIDSADFLSHTIVAGQSDAETKLELSESVTLSPWQEAKLTELIMADEKFNKYCTNAGRKTIGKKVALGSVNAAYGTAAVALAPLSCGLSVPIMAGCAGAVTGGMILLNKDGRKTDDKRMFRRIVKQYKESNETLNSLVTKGLGVAEYQRKTDEVKRYLQSFEQGLIAILALKDKNGKRKDLDKELMTVFKKINLVWHLKEKKIIERLNEVQEALGESSTEDLWSTEEGRDAIIDEYKGKVANAAEIIKGRNTFEKTSKVLSILGVETPLKPETQKTSQL